MRGFVLTAGLGLDLRGCDLITSAPRGQLVYALLDLPEPGLHGFQLRTLGVLQCPFDVERALGLDEGGVGCGCDFDLAALGGAQGEVHGVIGCRRDLPIAAPESEGDAWQRLVAPGDILVDDESVRLVANVDVCLDDRGVLVLPGEGELVRGWVENMARRGLRLHEGVAGLAGAEVELFGRRGPVLAGLHMVDHLAFDRLDGPVGGDDVLHGHDVELGALEWLAVIRACLEHARAALGLIVRELHDGHGGELGVVLDHHLEVLAVEEVGGLGRDLADVVRSGAQRLGERYHARLIRLELVHLRVIGVPDLLGDRVLGLVEELEPEARERDGLAGLGIGLDDLHVGGHEVVVDDIAEGGAVGHLLRSDLPVGCGLVARGGRRGVLSDRIALGVVGDGALHSLRTLSVSIPVAIRARVAAVVGLDRRDLLAGRVRYDVEPHARCRVLKARALVARVLVLHELDVEREDVLDEVVGGFQLEDAGISDLI